MSQYFFELNRLPKIGERVYIPNRPRNHISERHEHGNRFGCVVCIQSNVPKSLTSDSSPQDEFRFKFATIELDLEATSKKAERTVLAGLYWLQEVDND